MVLNSTALRISRLRTQGRNADGGGLYLQVRERTKSWLFRYSKGGRAYHLGLGPLHTLSLAEAREKARALRQLLIEGKDPLAEKRAQSATMGVAQARGLTFEQCADGYMRTHAATWKNVKHQAQWASTLANLADHRAAAGRGNRHRSSAARAGTDLDQDPGNRQARARPHRKRARLGHGPGSPPRREPCALARAILKTCWRRGRPSPSSTTPGPRSLR